MLGIRRSVVLLGAMAGWSYGQPALTTIQDILYRADGTRFSGTVFIRANSFLSGGGSNIATANVTIAVINGVLRVQLVPTTTASPGAQYNVTYASGGVNQFTEVWAVLPVPCPCECATSSVERYGDRAGAGDKQSNTNQRCDGIDECTRHPPHPRCRLQYRAHCDHQSSRPNRRRHGESGRLHAR